MRYRLRTLLIVLAIGPPVLASVWFFPTWAALVLSCIGLAAVILVAIVTRRDRGLDLPLDADEKLKMRVAMPRYKLHTLIIVLTIAWLFIFLSDLMFPVFKWLRSP